MLTTSFLKHISKKKDFSFPYMLKDWESAKSDCMSNHTEEVNLFKAPIKVILMNN
jgi:hypothetical protein